MMDSIHEEPSCRYLMRPVGKTQLSQSADRNIFAEIRTKTSLLPHLNCSQKIKGRIFDLVGSPQQREQWLQHQQSNKKDNPEYSDLNTSSPFKKTTTINRQTIMSRLTHEQQNMQTRERRQLQKYKQYQKYWESEVQKIRGRTQRQRKDKTLLEQNVKGIYAQENETHQFLSENYVNTYWEMSLRNNSKILKRQFLGNRYSDDQINELLQTEEGRKKIESTIPTLPLDQLKVRQKKDLSLHGRNKSLGESMTTYRSFGSNSSDTKQEVYKISYGGSTRWMSMDGLTQ